MRRLGIIASVFGVACSAHQPVDGLPAQVTPPFILTMRDGGRRGGTAQVSINCATGVPDVAFSAILDREERERAPGIWDPAASTWRGDATYAPSGGLSGQSVVSSPGGPPPSTAHASVTRTPTGGGPYSIVAATEGKLTVVGQGRVVRGSADVLPSSLAGDFEGRLDGVGCVTSGIGSESVDLAVRTACCNPFLAE